MRELLLLQSVHLVHRLDAGFSKEIPTGWIGQGGKTQGAGTRDQWKARLAEEVANVALEHKGWGNERAMAALESGASFHFPRFSIC